MAARRRKEILAELREELLSLPSNADGLADDIAAQWVEAEDAETQIVPSIPRVEDTEESRRRGRAVFISKDAKCTDCHGYEGQGNGSQTEGYEAKPSGGKWDHTGLHDAWGNINQPRDLTQGIYRGGRRPIDIFRRVRAGIKGTAMPAFAEGVISDEDLWHLVNYVKSIPFGKTAPASAPKAETKTSPEEPAEADAKKETPAEPGE